MVEPEIPEWRIYERMAAAFIAENLGCGAEFSITMNALLTGEISLAQRQIDLMVEPRWGDGRFRRIVVDAKHYKRRLTVKDVEAFEGMMRDCRADYGILVCPEGWSSAAMQRARDAITLKILTQEEANEKTDWALFAECNGCLAEESDPQRRGVVLWDGMQLLNHCGLWIILWTGKCDVCRQFQAWCWDCGEVFSLASGETHLCWCGDRNWTVLIDSGEADPARKKRVALRLVLTMDDSVTLLDRVSLA